MLLTLPLAETANQLTHDVRGGWGRGSVRRKFYSQREQDVSFTRAGVKQPVPSQRD